MKINARLIGIITSALIVLLLLFSCEVAEPLPSGLINGNNDRGRYVIEWESNQTEPYMNITVLHKGIETTTENIKEKRYEIDMYKGDLIQIGINYKETSPRPECYLSISRYKTMDLSSGVYNPDNLELLYEMESETNAIGFNGKLNKKGEIE